MADLLPSNASAFERAAAEAINPSARLAPALDLMRRAKLVNIPQEWLPFLVYEYGLGPVSPYFDPEDDILGEGVAWQRVRGTKDAIDRALAWVGFAAEIEEARVTRRRWNRFQLALDHFPETEGTDLPAIETLVGLSVPARSIFFRGWSGYDVREAEWSISRFSGARWSGSSGVRLHDGGPKWSFGETLDFAYTVGQDRLTALGAWIDPPSGTAPTWGAYTWGSTSSTWDLAGLSTRNQSIAALLSGRPVWIRFFGPTNNVLGNRRARVARPVLPDPAGVYEVNGSRYSPSGAGTAFYVEALTDFGDDFEEDVARIEVIFDAVPADPATPGLMYAQTNTLTGGKWAARRDVAAQLRTTVRNRVRFLLTF